MKKPKALGDIRLYVDMRKTNQAIISEQIPMSNVDEVFENLNGRGQCFHKWTFAWDFTRSSEARPLET